MKKITTFVVFFMIAFLFTGCGSKDEWELLENRDCCAAMDPSNVYWDNIHKSRTAYEETIAHFTTSDGKRTDDFGGVFIDKNGIYNICVVGTREPVKSDYLIYKRVGYSYNSLNSVYEGASKVMQEYSIWEVSICETCNRVLICIEDDNKIPLLIEHLKSQKLSKKGLLNIFVGEAESDINIKDLEERIIWNGTVDDIVDSETIIITIDKNFNSKQFTPDDFKIVEIVENSFSWLTKSAYDCYMETESLPEDFRHIIMFKIIDKGCQNLIEAIRKLEAVNFVNSASPNSYDSPDS